MSPRLVPKRQILDGQQLHRVIRRMATEIVERHRGVEDVVLVGIRTRGVPLAEALADEIERLEGTRVPIGTLDITLYRDDLSAIGPQPVVGETRFPGSIEGRVLVLCDDVLYTGRTIRAALDALADYGRPRMVELAVLIDRGRRELPIQGDVVGETVETGPDEHVEVHFAAVDGDDSATLMAVEEG